ncbi:MAG: hypothetical protein M3Q71_22370 [Chloroflexota bacterium]|jgi:hypothetical protein|nr:hypothetical protein [Chloroflexota bacterium]
MASCQIRMDSSSGNSTPRRFETCSGLHDFARDKRLLEMDNEILRRAAGYFAKEALPK